MNDPAVDDKIRSLTVVIPVFNEMDIIEKSIRTLLDILPSVCIDFEILIVNDGSTDGTGIILEYLAKSNDRIKIIDSACNQGLGGALRYGFTQASKELVFYTDADMPFHYSEIVRAARVMQGSGVDMLVGYRMSRVKEGVFRRVCSLAYNGFVRLVFGVGLRDINCAFKLVHRYVFKAVDLKASGSFIDAELVVKARYLGFTVEEFGVAYHPRQEGDSRLFRLAPILNTFLEMAKLYWQIVCLKKGPHKITRDAP